MKKRTLSLVLLFWMLTLGAGRAVPAGLIEKPTGTVIRYRTFELALGALSPPWI